MWGVVDDSAEEPWHELWGGMSERERRRYKREHREQA